MAAPVYTHVLSQKSVDLGRDTFIFSNKGTGSSEELLIGLNQTLTCASVATLLRWLRHFSPGLQGLNLCPANMEKSDVTPLAIWVREGSIGDPVGLDGVLPPGEYIWTGSMCETPSQLSFAELRDRYANDTLMQSVVGDAIDLYNINDGMRENVLSRDGNTCFVTGQSRQADIWWIFPPTWGYMMEKGTSPQTFHRQHYITESNMVSMHKDFIADFHNNAFGIDIDDNYRIVQFRPLKSKSPLSLLRCLPAHSDVDLSRLDPFLRLHFDWCIRANLFGGDAFREHQTQLAPLLQTLGVNFWTDEYDNLNKTDPGWLSVPGKAISELLVSKKVVTAEDAAKFGPSPEHNDPER